MSCLSESGSPVCLVKQRGRTPCRPGTGSAKSPCRCGHGPPHSGRPCVRGLHEKFGRFVPAAETGKARLFASVIRLRRLIHQAILLIAQDCTAAAVRVQRGRGFGPSRGAGCVGAPRPMLVLLPGFYFMNRGVADRVRACLRSRSPELAAGVTSGAFRKRQGRFRWAFLRRARSRFLACSPGAAHFQGSGFLNKLLDNRQFHRYVGRQGVCA